MGIIKEASLAPLIDLGNYPVIFSTDIARVDRLPNGLINLMLVELCMNSEGSLERRVVGRVIRPAHSVILASQKIVSTLKDSAKDILLATADCPLLVQ